MNNLTKTSKRLQILTLLILISLGCEPEETKDELLTGAPLQEASVLGPRSNSSTPPGQPKNLDSLESKPPVTGNNRAESRKRVGVLSEKGDFWIGMPHQAGSMKYVRLAENTEVQVLGLVEGYYKVVHRSMIGFLEKSIVNIKEPNPIAGGGSGSTPPSDAPAGEREGSAEPSPEPPAASSPPVTRVTPCTGRISEELFPGVSCAQYRSKVQEKVSTLENYIKRIIDKSEINREKSIDMACRLFVNEQARVYTSSLNETGRSRPIRKYLNSLMALNYEKVEIEWTNIQYVSELREGPDGRFYGFVHIEQKFQGFIDGKLAYGDITEKKITVVLEAYEVIDAEGEAATRWDVFLSDIGVEQTLNIQ